MGLFGPAKPDFFYRFLVVYKRLQQERSYHTGIRQERSLLSNGGSQSTDDNDDGNLNDGNVDNACDVHEDKSMVIYTRQNRLWQNYRAVNRRSN